MSMKQHLGPLMIARCDRALAALYANAKVAQGWASEYQLGMNISDALGAVSIFQIGSLRWDSAWNETETARMNVAIAFGVGSTTGVRNSGGGGVGGDGGGGNNRSKTARPWLKELPRDAAGKGCCWNHLRAHGKCGGPAAGCHFHHEPLPQTWWDALTPAQRKVWKHRIAHD